MRGRAGTEADGAPAVIRGVVRDITESKQARDETEKLRRDLAHAGRVTMLGQLSSALAHELNQPLGAIQRNAEAAAMLLQSNAPDLDEVRAIVSDIRKDDRRAVDVIARLRALLSRRSLEPEPVPVQGVVQDVLALVRADAAARQVRLDFAPPAGLPPASADRVHLSQVLLNLIVNAMDAVAHLPAASRRVAVEARLAHGMIEIAVADSGSGIARELAEKVFDPYYTTKSGGMGMGLPISRTIVEAHGGKLWVDDASSPGATFRFTLPLSQHGRA
jgi:C4-dicarboxylate-specific signal transduction histidine kinase